MLKKLLYFALMIAVISVYSGCSKDDSGNDPQPTPTPNPTPTPTFSLSSTTISDGTFQYIVFQFIPSMNCLIESVNVKAGDGSTYVYSAGNTLFIGNVAYALDAYLKVSGTWTFTFTGSIPEGGRFSRTEVFSVAGKENAN